METFNYMLITEENGLGEKQYRAHRVRPWYKGGNYRIGYCNVYSDHWFTSWVNKGELIDAIRDDAQYKRREPLEKFRIVLKEPIKV